MAAVEELCQSITEQLKLFDRVNGKMRRMLQEENTMLREKLGSVGAESPRSLSNFASPSSMPPQPLGVSKGSTLCTPRLNLSRAQDISNALHTEDLRTMSPETPRISKKQEDRISKEIDRLSVSGSEDDAFEPRSSRGSIFSFGEQGGHLHGVWARWHKIISTVRNMSLLGVERSKLESALLLRPAWETTKFDRPTSRRLSVSTWLTNSSAGPPAGRSMLLYHSDKDGCGPLSTRQSRWSRFVLHPDSRSVTTWLILGSFMILYDVLTFPLAGFDLDESDFALVVMWITTLFWTSDIIITFFRGVHHRGHIELRPSRICWLYAKTWLCVDITMVVIDWFVLYMTYGGDTSIAGASKVLRSGKALRAARVVRAIRLIRTIKVLQYLRDVFENIKSEYYQLLIKLNASIVAILVLSHYVTCSWFAQAHFNHSGERTWIIVFLGNDPRPSFSTEYLTSMHFALTQLAGSQNIVPQNAQERFIASVIIVFDIVIFSTLVGIITDIMAQFRSLTFERSREVNLIRKFFARTDMPPILESRIWHFFRRHYRSKNRCVNECEIEFFRCLPSSLKMDLHQHLYIPVLSEHPLFNCILKHDRYSLLAVCVSALKSATLAAEIEVFAEGDIARSMFFVNTGIMHYRAKQFNIDCSSNEGTWIAEATLWTKWMHCGRLTTQNNCEVLKIEADMFEKTIYERAETSEWFRGLRKYAACFAQRVSDSFDTDRPITDVDKNVDGMLESIVDSSFFYMRIVGSEESIEDANATKAPAAEEHRNPFNPFGFKFQRAMSSLSVMSMGSGAKHGERRLSHRENNTGERRLSHCENNTGERRLSNRENNNRRPSQTGMVEKVPSKMSVDDLLED